jgi:hypothetical protein
MNEIFLYKTEVNDLFFKAGYSDLEGELLYKLWDIKLISKVELKCHDVEFKRTNNRKSFQCPTCGKQYYPMKGTIFEKTKNPCNELVFITALFSDRKSTISGIWHNLFYEGKEKNKHDITWKSAHRIFHLVRNNIVGDRVLLNKLN